MTVRVTITSHSYNSLVSLKNQNSIFELSPFLKQLASRHPGWLPELDASERLQNSSHPTADQLKLMLKESGLMAGLRRYRNREMMRIIWRDLSQLAALEETMADLSCLAEICLQSALEHHTKALVASHGEPCDADGQVQHMVIIGLGKLGGLELNMSSDIDIIFCYQHGGNCCGRRGLSNEQFFTRLARNIIRSLSEVNADGFCFRVDTRLRPFGASGPLVSSFAALEQYYQREGRDWERYAMIKARPVAGDLVAGAQLLDELRPFVYRRYIDFGAIDAMHEMHQKVREDAARLDRFDDIKRGPGGIREIEFLVQAFQLLRGGRETALQTPSLLTAVGVLLELQVLSPTEGKELVACYRLLRNTENRIQSLHDQQTHLLPDGEDGLRVARAMGFDDLALFRVALKNSRDSVQLLFEESLPPPPEPAANNEKWRAQWQMVRNAGGDIESGVANRKPLAHFVKRLTRLSLSQRASTRLDQYMPLLLEQLETLSAPDAVIIRIFDLVSAICRRSAYLSLLVQNPGANKRMLDLFSASKQIASVVTRYPALLDELIDPSLGAHPPDDAGIKSDIQRILKAHSTTETTLQNLNYLKQVTNLRIAVAVLHTSMSATEAQSIQSQLAQHLIQATLTLSMMEMESRHGRLSGPALAVIAYGSLGACSLRSDSDLDLVFLYCVVDGNSDGPRAITAERYHTGVARRLLSLLSATTPSGRLYKIDARLRPNGRAGLLVSSVEAFTRYQLEQAWVWELQALTRARPIAGDKEIAHLFEQARIGALTVARNRHTVAQDVLDMRVRLRKEYRSNASPKHMHGGLLDIEFVVQLGLLLNAASHPEVIASTRLQLQLHALHDCGWLDVNAFEALTSTYGKLDEARNKAALYDEPPVTDTTSDDDAAKLLCREILTSNSDQVKFKA